MTAVVAILDSFQDIGRVIRSIPMRLYNARLRSIR
jgi:hypothetical protein